MTIIDNKYATCSCGLPVRLKGFPCRHIFAVLKDYNVRMFGLRWLIQYQHNFGRDNKKINDLLRRLEKEELNRNYTKKEDINVEGMLCDDRFKRDVHQSYPIPIDGTSCEEIQVVLDIKRSYDSLRPVIRGENDILSLYNTTNSIENDENYDPEVVVHYSQATQEMMDDDEEFDRSTKIQDMQRSLKTLKNSIEKGTVNKDQIM